MSDSKFHRNYNFKKILLFSMWIEKIIGSVWMPECLIGISFGKFMRDEINSRLGYSECMSALLVVTVCLEIYGNTSRLQFSGHVGNICDATIDVLPIR